MLVDLEHDYCEMTSKTNRLLSLPRTSQPSKPGSVIYVPFSYVTTSVVSVFWFLLFIHCSVFPCSLVRFLTIQFRMFYTVPFLSLSVQRHAKHRLCPFRLAMERLFPLRSIFKCHPFVISSILPYFRNEQPLSDKDDC